MLKQRFEIFYSIFVLSYHYKVSNHFQLEILNLVFLEQTWKAYSIHLYLCFDYLFVQALKVKEEDVKARFHSETSLEFICWGFEMIQEILPPHWKNDKKRKTGRKLKPNSPLYNMWIGCFLTR